MILHLKSGKKIKADCLLWCNGRTGNTDKLGLENIGIKVNSRGQIEVDQAYRTQVSNIFAAGDVIGWPSLASAASSRSSPSNTGAYARRRDGHATGSLVDPARRTATCASSSAVEKEEPCTALFHGRLQFSVLGVGQSWRSARNRKLRVCAARGSTKERSGLYTTS